MKRVLPVLLAATLATGASAAHAGEVYGGVLIHGVDTPFTFETNEEGVDLQAGVRSEPIEALSLVGKPSLYAFGSVNTAGDTNFVAAGVSWKIDLGPVYLRPGVGLALHDAPEFRTDPATGVRTDLGSRVLFEPELSIGLPVSDRISVEASWVHISNARLFNSEQNPGIDMMGLRANLSF